MEQPRQLVGRFLLQQERQPGLGSKVHPVDRVDCKSRQPGGGILDDRLSYGPASADRPVDELCLRNIKKSPQEERTGRSRKFRKPDAGGGADT